MGRLIDKRQWTFTDYLTIIESLNRVETDTVSLPLVASAHRFYAGLDSVSTYGTNAARTIELYQKMLDQTLKDGFNPKQTLSPSYEKKIWHSVLFWSIFLPTGIFHWTTSRPKPGK